MTQRCDKEICPEDFADKCDFSGICPKGVRPISDGLLPFKQKGVQGNMGYYSNVNIMITRQDYHRILDEVKKENKATQSLLDESAVSPKMTAEASYVWLKWPNVKWYEGMPELYGVDHLMELIRKGDYQLIRLGENSDDCEEISQGIELLHTERKVVFDD